MNNKMTEKEIKGLYTVEDEASYLYNVYLSTDEGKVRSQNEDNYAINDVFRALEDSKKKLKCIRTDEPLLCAVFDGMGGEANGELASKLSAEIAALVYYELIKNNNVNVDDLATRFVNKSNNAVVEMLTNTQAKRGGSTVVMAMFYHGRVFMYSLGDSRIYLFRDEKLTQISVDQTLAEKKVRANIYTEEEALTSPDRHKLTAFLGVDVDGEGVVPQIYQPIELRYGDKLLLCSDGLYDMCMDDQIEALMKRPSNDACLDLLHAALDNGGEDNVTCMIIERAKPKHK